MTWLKNPEPAQVHECAPPTRERRLYLPTGPAPGANHRYSPGALPATLRPVQLHRIELVPAGQEGAVWLCDECQAVWVVRCVATYGPMTSDGHRRQTGLKRRWRKANALHAWYTRRKFQISQTGG